MSAQTGVSMHTSQMSTVSAMSSDASQTGQPQLLMPPEPPKPSEAAMKFIDSIDVDDFKYLLFSDNLVTTSDTGKELGEFNVTIEMTKRLGNDCYHIHANSHGAIDSVPCGTSITTYVSKKLETIEQQHHEYVKLENHPLDRKTFIVRQDDGYVVNRVITQGEDVQRTAQTFSLDAMAGFVSEGSNLLLQRLLIKKGLPPNFQLLSFDSDVNLCAAVYRPLEERTQLVGDQDVRVSGIERTINSVSDLPTAWQAYFLKDGHLSNRVQVGSPVTMKLAYLPKAVEADEFEEKPKFPKKPLNWEEDMQLYSKFLDRKEELKGDHAVYMRHHPELKALLADFLQFLLLRKPDDVISFAAEYFSSFSANIPSMAPYLKSAEPTMFPRSKTNPKIQDLIQKNSKGT
ncbi:unnamed protein product [Owenia fusiformis]|uniref:Ciliogenesis-associated TTC17-interacting protein n=1 Tax=Owenia fusiformis TaxID=6347 RepID=A0A8J1UKV9_OWEFU|nr:unnamed protein product [Owenia fusiformis]